jgi:hypothetical protein
MSESSPSNKHPQWVRQYEAWYPRDDEDGKGHFRPKPQSDENRTKEQIARKYDSKSNICPTCNTARSTKDGSCWC